MTSTPDFPEPKPSINDEFDQLLAQFDALQKTHEEVLDRLCVLENALVTFFHDPTAKQIALLKSSGYFDRMSESYGDVIPQHECRFCHEARPRYRVAVCPCLSAQYCIDKDCQKKDWTRHREAEHLEGRLHQAGLSHEDLAHSHP